MCLWNAKLMYGSTMLLFGLCLFMAVAQAQQPASIEKAKSAEDLSFEIAKARLAIEEGSESEGISMFDALLTKDPMNQDLLLSAASAKASLGRKREALSLLDRAAELGSLDHATESFREVLLREQRPFGRFEMDLRNSGSSAKQYIERFSAEASLPFFPSLPLKFGLISELNHANFEDIQRVDSSIRDFKGTRNRNQLYLRYLFQEQHELSVSAYQEEFLFGGGLKYQHQWNRATSSISADLHQANWDYIGAVADYGVRDRIRLSQDFNLEPCFFSLSTSSQRYSLKEISGIEYSQSLGMLAKYVILNDKIILDFKYLVQAEYGITERNKASPGGWEYNPLPFNSFEYHVMNITSAYRISANLEVGAFGGYAYNRLGESAPNIGAFLDYHVGVDLSAHLQVERSFSTAGADSTEDRLFCSLTWWI